MQKRCDRCKGLGTFMGNGMTTIKCIMCDGTGFTWHSHLDGQKSQAFESVKRKYPDLSDKELQEMIDEAFNNEEEAGEANKKVGRGRPRVSRD